MFSSLRPPFCSASSVNRVLKVLRGTSLRNFGVMAHQRRSQSSSFHALQKYRTSLLGSAASAAGGSGGGGGSSSAVTTGAAGTVGVETGTATTAGTTTAAAGATATGATTGVSTGATTAKGCFLDCPLDFFFLRRTTTSSYSSSSSAGAFAAKPVTSANRQQANASNNHFFMAHTPLNYRGVCPACQRDHPYAIQEPGHRRPCEHSSPWGFSPLPMHCSPPHA